VARSKVCESDSDLMKIDMARRLSWKLKVVLKQGSETMTVNVRVSHCSLSSCSTPTVTVKVF